MAGSPTMRRLQELKEPGKTTITEWMLKAPRRVASSAANRMLANTGKKDLAESVILNTAGMTGTGAALGGVIVPATIAAGTAGAVITGPIFASVVGIVGVLALARSMYSNREKAHETLTPYVWSYIDANPPVKIDDDHIKAAALSLIMDGYAQQKLQVSKLTLRANAFNKWSTEYESLSRYHQAVLDKPNARHNCERIQRQEQMRIAHLNKGFGTNGAVFELVRRLNHRANYLQAYSVCGKFFQDDRTPLTDFALTHKGVREFRDLFQKLAHKIDSHERVFVSAVEAMRN